jgi:hypothetical protein
MLISMPATLAISSSWIMSVERDASVRCWLRNARNIIFPNVTAERLVQTTGTGTTTLRGIIDTNSTGTTHPGLSTNVGDIDSGTANPSLPTTLATRNVNSWR